ncbi:hypothetical protein PVAND_008388 [Polypedilum vanderplanki]|uniref:Dedicator of cytokinesis protein 9 n=1 Tax=Polypedilum vanderplanki TaxID=319348 RepID=A0A9J6CAW1_POLVA|nr:hypothetical protein PVAND_008388 [Polypedilum vanderplanki]
MTERKFTRNLNSRGMAQQLRESVSKVIHQDLLLTKPIIADPIDFESFILKNKTLIQNDPQRELLLYPNDDVSEVILPRKFRTITTGIPSFISESPKKQSNSNSTENGSVNGKEKESMGNLLTRQALKTYETANHMILYKYSVYGGNCGDLPKTAQIEPLKEEVYEIDTDPDRVEENRSQKDLVTKQGYLYKGADTTSDRMFGNIGSKSFKRRYCYLRQEVDGTYILEIHKDEKQCDAKTTIVMDFCTEVVPNPKRGRYCFELKMSEGGQKCVTLAAEDQVDLDDWIKKLTSVLQQNKLQEDKRAASLERTAPPPSPSPNAPYGTLKGLEQSMNPQLIKYGRETDMSIAQSRRENRKRLFGTIQNQFVKSPSEPNVEPFKEIFGQRILIKCEEIRFRLQASLDENEKLCQIEPYLTSLALYDAKAGRKLTENFYFDLNEEHVREMLHCNGSTSPCCSPKSIKTNGTLKNGNSNSNGHHHDNNNHCDYTQEWLMHPRQAILSVTAPHPDIFIVVRIEKILQGGINQSSEPYLKTTKDMKLSAKTLKSIKMYAQKVGHYRMPFAWTAKPLFRLYSSDLDNESEFPGIFRQECNKLKDDEILKVLNDYRKPEKLSKFTLIPGTLKLSLQQITTELPKNCFTTTLVPIKPFALPPVEKPTLEIAEFPGNSERDIYPYTTFINHLFIYPTSLNFETQKIFSRARNIALTIELRETDTVDAKPIECIYGRPEQEKVFISQITCPVLHHNTSPTWYEEIKMQLPTNLTPQHHLLFTFSHVSCDIKKKEPANSAVVSVGYAWLPLLNKGRLNIEDQSLAVAVSLPPGYLSIQPLGLGKGNAGPEITWILDQKPIFNIHFRLNSTLFSTDQHLHNLFAHAEKLLESTRGPIPSEMETCKVLKAAHAIHISAVINFLPTIFDQLFILLITSYNEDVSCNIIRLLINLIHMVAEEAGRKELILSYVKYNFKTPAIKVKSNTSPSAINTVHGEICKHLPTLLNPTNTDFLLVNKFMKFSSVIFDIIVKSMAHHLLSSGRIKMHRNERFPKEFEKRIENLFQVLMPYLISRYKELPLETQQLNKSLSVFAKKCLTLMDRGFVFKLIRQYMDKWSPGDPRALQEFKFNFVQEVCSHEHYIALNLPLILGSSQRSTDILNQFCLSEEFCRQHFLTALMLQEVRSSLNEISHIRKMALGIFKDLLAKHDLDERYQNKGQLARIAMLYVPWLGIVIENINRIPDGLESKDVGHNRIASNSSYVFARDMTPKLIPQVSTPTPSTNSTLTNTPKSKRFTLHVDNSRVSSHFKDMIAGHAPLRNGISTSSLNSDCSSMSQETTVVIRNGDDNNSSYQYGHNRSISMSQTPVVLRTDKFTISETKDMLICFLFTIKHLSHDHLITWWHNCTGTETASFFQVLDLCLIVFRYVGKKNIQLSDNTKISSNKVKSSTLPARIVNSDSEHSNVSSIHDTGTLNHQNREDLIEETVKLHKALQESNLATEIGMIILDCVGLYCVQFKESMVDGGVLPKIAQVYLRFLQLGQSESLSKHVFAALRAFINNFSTALFKGTAMLCGQFVYELLKCCDSRLQSVRQESCAVLYLLMRSNFEFSGRKGLTRVHLQVIISVSQMIGSVIGLNNARFQESLSLINSYATSDKAMKGTGFPMEVKDLTKRVRTVLMATHAMQARQTDPERLLELQLSLANSYASTPELRHTWLVTMARNHESNNNISEAACCHLHIAALMAEYLKLKGSDLINFGAESFAKISRNIPRDEKGLKLDSGAQDSQYTETLLLEQLKNCADFLDRAERLECLGDLYRLIIPILEHRRDYPALIESYNHLSQSYQRVIEFNRTGKRLLGRFYRVICYGQIYFDDEHAVEYIFKEPKVTSLSEISLRLKKQFEEKFGADVVKMIMDSNQVNVAELDPKLAYIQVTHVTPYFIKDELDIKQTEFEQNHDIDTFMFETPFSKNGGGARCTLVEDQWKRRTILTTHYSFPYVLKRIQVKDKQIVELSPIEVAIDEMQNKITELADVVFATTIDVKKLQLRLQGSVAVQVNAGPLAYANSFLDPKLCGKYDTEKVEDLKEVFREFIKVSYAALQVNARVISNDQVEYHNSLKENFNNMCVVLSELMNETLIALDDDQNHPHRNSLALFSAISGTPNNSSTA